ncbi:hypothetical protein L5515_005801 [Caenorhabditis briggsae]|uniref:Uncharacterized protein n=1 Tax=Caenorhabditis briggsae TaxID=6238 RepID=A0AAE9EYW7_CAEBR|nr:hypothetical protein L5515_005801 [Caenorhabditis briggsae]
MKKFSLHLALSTLQKFITADICDVYLESTVFDERVFSRGKNLLQRTWKHPFRRRQAISFHFPSKRRARRGHEAGDCCDAVRSYRQKLSPKLIFSGVLEMQPIETTPSEIRRLADDVTQTCGLELDNVCREVDEDIKKNYMTTPVPGHDAKLWLRIDSESKKAFIECLKKQLEKTVSRQEQYESKVVSYEAICSNPNTKPLNVVKTKKKASKRRSHQN